MQAIKNYYKAIRKFNIMELTAITIIFVMFVLFVLNTFSVRRQELRNDERRSDVTAIDYALKVFKEKEGYYPSSIDYNDNTWREENLDTVEARIFKAPHGIIGADAEYIYQAKLGDEFCEKAKQKCEQFSLRAKLEAGSEDFVVRGQ